VNPQLPADRKIVVAIVDDDASILVSVQRLCRALDLDATVYASGAAFLVSLDDGTPRPDCLLLDANMPQMTGAELLRRLAAQGVRIPTIVFTADDSVDVSMQYASVDLVAYLGKPITGDDLLEAVARAVGGEASSGTE
jgi:FixJ family two-component response regulator